MKSDEGILKMIEEMMEAELDASINSMLGFDNMVAGSCQAEPDPVTWESLQKIVEEFKPKYEQAKIGYTHNSSETYKVIIPENLNGDSFSYDVGEYKIHETIGEGCIIPVVGHVHNHKTGHLDRVNDMLSMGHIKLPEGSGLAEELINFDCKVNNKFYNPSAMEDMKEEVLKMPLIRAKYYSSAEKSKHALDDPYLSRTKMFEKFHNEAYTEMMKQCFQDIKPNSKRLLKEDSKHSVESCDKFHSEEYDRVTCQWANDLIQGCSVGYSMKDTRDDMPSMEN
jgi:hypothetical protein